MDEDEKRDFLEELSEKYKRDIAAATPYYSGERLEIRKASGKRKMMDDMKVKFDLKRNKVHMFEKEAKSPFVLRFS